jgi:hypothetical protein
MRAYTNLCSYEKGDGNHAGTEKQCTHEQERATRPQKVVTVGQHRSVMPTLLSCRPAWRGEALCSPSKPVSVRLLFLLKISFPLK